MFRTAEKKSHSKRWCTMAALFLGTALTFYTPQAIAQESEERGTVWTEHFDGSSSADGTIFSITSAAGHNFNNKYFGVDAGIPVYIARAPASVQGSTSSGYRGSRSSEGLEWM